MCWIRLASQSEKHTGLLAFSNQELNIYGEDDVNDTIYQMVEITQIKPQRNGKRVNVYLDGRFAFGLDLENYLKLNLKVGQEYSEEEIEEIVKKAEFQKTLNKLLRFATLRPRSEKEITVWLKKKKVHESLYKDLFNRLKRLELLDDEKFARWWVEQRQNFRPRSKRILKYELRSKGIGSNTIEDALSDVEIDETKIAKDILDKKKYKWERLKGFEKKRKMSEFLARKGFGWDVIKKMVKESTRE